MSQSPASSFRLRRQYVARACNNCRHRRCKCDGAQPTCAACLSSGYECTWGTEGEGVWRPATKQMVESLRVKIQQLESEIEQYKRDEPEPHCSPIHPPTAPPANPGPIETLQSILITIPTDGIGQELSENHPQLPPHSDTLLQLPHPVSPSQLAPAEVTLLHILPAPRYQYIFNIDLTLALDEQYPLHQANLICQWDRHLPNLSPVRISRLEHDTILSRCFSYGAGYSFGLLPDLFLADMLECLAPEPTDLNCLADSRYYTPLLHCSLLAFGARFSDNPEIRAKETRAKLASHAKQWIDEEFSRPSSSLMLSLALLSEHHSGIGERRAGHMYMGMAVCAARGGLGTSSSLVQDWHQSLMALEANRLTELPPPQASISFPMALEPDSRPLLTGSLDELFNHGDYFKHSAQCFIQVCRLMVIASRIVGQPLQLETWFDALPEGVLIRQRSTLTFPPVLALYITYWWLILHAHRSFIERNPSTNPEPCKDLSLKMCARAAEKLIQLFNTFEKQFGWKYFPRNLVKAMYECGLALVKERDAASSASRKKRATAMEGVEVCIRALGVAGEVWPYAVRMRDELMGLVG